MTSLRITLNIDLSISGVCDLVFEAYTHLSVCSFIAVVFLKLYLDSAAKHDDAYIAASNSTLSCESSPVWML